jgi:5-methylcytosine-specific restriction enzyme A
MARKKPNTFQKLVRGGVRNIINQINSQQPSTLIRDNNQKLASNQKKQKSIKQQESTKRSRYISKSIRVAALHRDNYRCVFCGRTSKQVELQIDHILPFSKGGSNEIDNLQTLCIDCNLGKSDYLL